MKYFVCGRMNPLTNGHIRLIEFMESLVGEGDESMIYMTTSHDTQSNPLATASKLELARKVLNRPINLTASPFAVIDAEYAAGVREITMVVGDDRAAISSRLDQYGKKIGMDIRLSVMTRDGVSATRARDAAIRGDFGEFSSLTPKAIAEETYRAVRRALGVE